MNPGLSFNQFLVLTSAVVVVTGCSSTPDQPKTQMGADGLAYKATDKIDRVYLAEGFDFTGFDAMVVPGASLDTSVKAKDEKEQERLDLLQRQLPVDFAATLVGHRVFPAVLTSEAELKPGAKGLKLDLKVMKFSRGSSSARWMVGFGAGMPYVQIRGTVTALGDTRPLFVFEADEHGDWFGAGYSSTKSIQQSAALELAEDIVQFMSDVSSKKAIHYR